MAEHGQAEGEAHEKHGGGGHGGGGHGPGGHGGGHEEHDGPAEWIVSFADNVALLMGFFVILLAFSMAKTHSGRYTGEGTAAAAGSPDFIDAVIGIRDAFHNPVSLASTDPAEQALVRRLRQRRGELPLNQEGPRGHQNQMQSIRPSKYFNLCGSVPFDQDSSKLNEAGQKALRDVVNHLRGLRLIVQVRGHVSAAEACNLPDRGLQLSFDRAMTIARVLNENEVEWRQIRILACGDGDRVEPISYGSDEQGSNQRAEVILTEELMPEYTPTTESSPQVEGAVAEH
jgi:flagellar motor protein MotB